MANPYYSNTFAGQPGQSARAEDVNNQFTGVATGFTAVYTAVQSAVQGQSGEVLTPLPAAATRALKWLYFDSNGNPTLISAPFNWRGAWAPSTAYNVGDIVTAAPNNSLYLCNTAHTSGSTFSPTPNWTLFVSLNGVFYANYQIVSGAATITATPGASYFTDSSLGDITINLPTGVLGASPINVTWVNGNLATGQTQSIVAAAGQYIEGSTQNTLNIDTSPMSITLAYCNATYGWKLRTMG